MSAQPQGGPDAPLEESRGGPAAFFTPVRIKQLVIAGVVILVGVTAVLVWQGMQEEEAETRWDEYRALRAEHEPGTDPQWEDPHGVYAAQRDRYVRALEAFLEKRAAPAGTVLEPQVRWRIARVLADHILSMNDVLDLEKRRPHYEKALAQLKTIRDEHPDFPLNWEMFSNRNYPSLTRQLLAWFETNLRWEEEHLPRAKAPDGTHTLVFRTTKGDVRLSLYRRDAPQWTEAMLERAIAGFYDGTALVERRQAGDALTPREAFVRGGSEASREAKAYDRASAVVAIDTPTGGGLLPEESRNRIPLGRGVVAAWHDPVTEYDRPAELLFVVNRSPALDFEYTPVGKVADEASLETLDRIFAQAIWGDDPELDNEATERDEALDALQVPVRIVKVLVYDADGALVEPAASDRLPTKAPATDTEGRLDALERDAHRAPTPERPGRDGDDGEGDDGDVDDGGDDGDGG